MTPSDTLNKLFEVDGDEIALICQHCGFDYLHHGQVEVFERHEDGEGLHISVFNLTVSVDQNMKGNPSSRRDGISIHFSCEGCDGQTTLNIYQHKGRTYLDARKFKKELREATAQAGR